MSSDTETHPEPTSSGRSAARRPAPAGAMTLQSFNTADGRTAAELLGGCLDVDEWVTTLSAGRPYPDLQALRGSGAAAASHLSWEQVAEALDRHPRIGEKTAAVAGTGTESAWSSDEQAGMRAEHADPLVAGNRAYEKRFGHIFLICADGLSGEQILANLNDRLTNDPPTEKFVVIEELRKIALLRLAKAVSG